MITPADKVYCYHYNAIGSTIAITDKEQNLVNKYAYAPFGEILNQEEEIPQPFKFVGRYGVMSEPSGYYYMRARYYDPMQGRFISEDPTGFEGGDVNLYAYAGNNPMLVIDPLGLCGGNVGNLPGLGIALIGLTTDDATVIGIADNILIPIVAGALVLEFSKYNKKGPIWNAPGMPGDRLRQYEQSQPGSFTPPPNFKKGDWWKKVIWAIAKVAEAFYKD